MSFCAFLGSSVCLSVHHVSKIDPSTKWRVKASAFTSAAVLQGRPGT